MWMNNLTVSPPKLAAAAEDADGAVAIVFNGPVSDRIPGTFQKPHRHRFKRRQRISSRDDKPHGLQKSTHD